jgi:hypothetical protein
MRTLVAGFLFAASLFGQYGHQRFSWQEACYKNFALPYCQGNDFAIKPEKGKSSSLRGIGADVDPFPATNVTAADIMAGTIDWRFADPSADMLVGFHAKKLATGTLARKASAQLLANFGLAPAEIDSVLDRLSGVEQVGISVSQSHTVVMITGRGSDSAPPPLEPGWKAVPVVGNALLVGPADAVDQAVQRLAKDDPPGELMRVAMKRQAVNEFWAIGFAAGLDAEHAKVKSFSMQLLVRDHITSALALEFREPPDAKTLGAWAPALKAVTEGNLVHVTTMMEADEVQQKLSQIAASPIGEHLAALVKPTAYLPIHEATAPEPAKPKIYGLD